MDRSAPIQRRLKSRKGQSVVEMALFGSLILFVFGYLLSYVQRYNDEQYTQMEAFRRALKAATTYEGNESSGAGASVQYTLIQSRRHVDLSGSLGKGSGQLISGSANVYWAVPKTGSESQSLTVYKVNDDELSVNYRDYVDKSHDSTDDDGNKRQKYWSFEPGNLTQESDVHFNETNTKTESQGGIRNRRESALQEQVHFVIPYKVVEKDKDNSTYESTQSSGTLLDMTQNVYRGSDGQYHYSTSIPAGNTVTRTRQWDTPF